MIRRTVQLVVLMIIFPFFMKAQQREVLDWEFFKNDRPANAKWQAFTWYNIFYRYRVLSFEGERAKLSFDVTSKMDTAKSYFETARRLKNDTSLLKHEQGHADIAFIYAVKLKDTYANTTFLKANYKEHVKEIFDRIFAQMMAEQEKYDTEVDHSKNKEQQRRWNSYFEKTIAQFNLGG